MGVFFLVLAVLVSIVAYVIFKVIVVISASIRNKKYLNAVITTVILLCFLAFMVGAAIKTLDYYDKVMSEGLR